MSDTLRDNRTTSDSISFKPDPTIRLTFEGRAAVIDFSGEAVTFSGDLPVDDAAKVFFRAVGRHLIRAA